jgi:predicted nucleotidyltransferase
MPVLAREAVLEFAPQPGRQPGTGTAALALLSPRESCLRSAGLSAVGVFGSCARGTETRHSDIDIIAVCPDWNGETRAAGLIRRILGPLRRPADVNFPSGIGIGTVIWANCARDARMAFGALPEARPWKVPIRMDRQDGMLVLEAMVARWPKLGPAFERQRAFPDEDIGVLARRLLANGLSQEQARGFVRRYDEMALDILGRCFDWAQPAQPGPDTRKPCREPAARGPAFAGCA